MQSKQRGRPDLLEILFEKRNKDYGAYSLRRGYSKRMKKSLGITFGLCGVFVFYFSLLSESLPHSTPDPGKETVTIIDLMPPSIEKNIKEELQGSKTKRPKLKKAVEEKVPVIVNKEIEYRLSDAVSIPALMDDLTSVLEFPSGMGKGKVGAKESGSAGSRPEEMDSADIVLNRYDQVDEPAAFPGGMEALQKFIQYQIRFPGEPDRPSIFHARVKFVIDKEGKANRFEPEGGESKRFNEEVIRVLQKMPRWKPAVKKGKRVGMRFILPVTYRVDPD